MEGTAELETLVLRWHGDAEPGEALGVQVGLHACGHAVGALETSPSATQGGTAGPGPSNHTQYRMQKHYSSQFFPSNDCTFLLEQDSHAVTAVTTTHSGCDKPC